MHEAHVERYGQSTTIVLGPTSRPLCVRIDTLDHIMIYTDISFYLFIYPFIGVEEEGYVWSQYDNHSLKQIRPVDKDKMSKVLKNFKVLRLISKDLMST